MAFKPNYAQARAGRNRAKQEKLEEKLREQQEAKAARRRQAQDGDEAPASAAPPPGHPATIERTRTMPPKKRILSSFVSFDVTYVDGSRTSNRKVPMSILGGLDGDEPARAIIEAQDKQIGEASGRPRADIKSLSRSPA